MEAPVPQPVQPGEVLVRNTCTSVDPGLRLRLRESGPAGYFTAFPLAQPMDEIMTVGEVVESRAEGFAPGDTVWHASGWRDYAVVTAGEQALGGVGTLRRLDVGGHPAAGVPRPARRQRPHRLRRSLRRCAGLREGDVVWVSAAAGAVGSLAAQIAKLRGHRVIGSAGRTEKVRYLLDELGLDAAFDYHARPGLDLLREAAPDGIDVYFDNVGGDHLEAALERCATGDGSRSAARSRSTSARAAAGAEQPLPGRRQRPHAARLPRPAATCTACRGARASSAAGSPKARLAYRETVVDGLERAPEALARMLRGDTIRQDARPDRVTTGPEAPRTSAFPPIAEYGFLSDSEAMALVAPGGDIEWMRLPRPDSPSVFGALLDRDAGSFRVGPTDVADPSGRRYLPGTMVLETTWMAQAGWLVVQDALLVGRWHHEHERSGTHRRTPTDYDAAHVLVRTVRCVHGSVELQVECEPVFDYGRTPAEWAFDGPGYGSATATAPDSELRLRLRLATDLRLGLEGGRARARLTLREGDCAFAALAWSEHPLPETFADAEERLAQTAQFWREWLAAGRFPDHPGGSTSSGSALTLKGLIFAPTGAMLAAATTSLPETPAGERNWDYRFAWIRDSTFGLWGLYTLGFDAEAERLLLLRGGRRGERGQQ